MGIRGATTADEDGLEPVLEATLSLLTKLQTLNGFDPADIASIIFTTTGDLRSTFPARAARRLGWTEVPMLCAQEIAAPSTIARCIRVLIHWNTDKATSEIRHAYLRGSRILRPDWAFPPMGGAASTVEAPERPTVEVEAPRSTAGTPVADAAPAPVAIDVSPIAYLGSAGSYSHEALLAVFGEDVDGVSVGSFRAAFDTLHSGRATAALMPVENSTTGAIYEVYDLLVSRDLVVMGEVILPVRHALLAKPGATLAQITEVMSHPQALMQCDAWISTHGWLPRAVSDTAAGAEAVAAGDRLDVAAIGSPIGAPLHGLEVLARDIQDVSQNFTRFLLVVSPQAVRPGAFVPALAPTDEAASLRSSIVFATRHVAGALYASLAEFSVRDVNLTRIASRPDKRTPWNYLFYVDFIGSADDPNIAHALAALERHTTYFRLLGSYPTRAL